MAHETQLALRTFSLRMRRPAYDRQRALENG
jgi:hypothetical protein